MRFVVNRRMVLVNRESAVKNRTYAQPLAGEASTHTGIFRGTLNVPKQRTLVTSGVTLYFPCGTAGTCASTVRAAAPGRKTEAARSSRQILAKATQALRPCTRKVTVAED